MIFLELQVQLLTSHRKSDDDKYMLLLKGSAICSIIVLKTMDIACLTHDENKDNNERKNSLSHLVDKPTMWFPNRSDTNRPVQSQKQARSLKFRI